MAVEGHELQLQHHPTGAMVSRAPDWIVLAVPAAPAEGLYLELRDLGVEVHRVGDAVAPRRAHAAVVDGERVGAAIPSLDAPPAGPSGHWDRHRRPASMTIPMSGAAAGAVEEVSV
jgi:hypothetical protein